MIEDGILYGIIALIGFGLTGALAKTPIRRIGATKTMAYRNLLVSLFILIGLIYSIGAGIVTQDNFSPYYILLAFLISFIGYIGFWAFYKAMSKSDVGIVSPIANSSIIFTVLFSILFFGDTLTMEQTTAIGLIILGILLISIDFKNIRKSQLFSMKSGLPYALISCFTWGLVFALFKIPVNVIGPILNALIVETVILVSSASKMKIRKETFALKDKKILKHIVPVAFFGAVGTLAYNIGITLADVSIVAAITFSNPLIATIYGRIVYKEKLKLVQYVAGLLIVTGIVLISV